LNVDSSRQVNDRGTFAAADLIGDEHIGCVSFTSSDIVMSKFWMRSVSFAFRAFGDSCAIGGVMVRQS